MLHSFRERCGKRFTFYTFEYAWHCFYPWVGCGVTYVEQFFMYEANKKFFFVGFSNEVGEDLGLDVSRQTLRKTNSIKKTFSNKKLRKKSFWKKIFIKWKQINTFWFIEVFCFSNIFIMVVNFEKKMLIPLKNIL